jgi:hypothetical protein
MLTGLTPSNSFARNEISVYCLIVSVVMAALAKRAVRVGCLFKKVASSHGQVYYFSI